MGQAIDTKVRVTLECSKLDKPTSWSRQPSYGWWLCETKLLNGSIALKLSARIRNKISSSHPWALMPVPQAVDRVCGRCIALAEVDWIPREQERTPARKKVGGVERAANLWVETYESQTLLRPGRFIVHESGLHVQKAPAIAYERESRILIAKLILGVPCSVQTCVFLHSVCKASKQTLHRGNEKETARVCMYVYHYVCT